MSTKNEGRDPTAAEEWLRHKNLRMRHLRRLWAVYCGTSTSPTRTERELGCFEEYALGFDYVPARTFSGQRWGYWRYQLSYGGPSEEVRFYGEYPGNPSPSRVSFVLIDCGTWCERSLRGRDLALMLELWSDYFLDGGAVQSAYDEAMWHV